MNRLPENADVCSQMERRIHFWRIRVVPHCMAGWLVAGWLATAWLAAWLAGGCLAGCGLAGWLLAGWLLVGWQAG